MTDPIRVDPTLDELPLGDLYAEREDARREEDFQIILRAPTSRALKVDTSSEGLARSAAGGARMPAGATFDQPVAVDISEEGMARTAERATAATPARPRLTAPQESTAEVVRERAMANLADPTVRRVLDLAAKTLTGLGLEDIQRRVETGTLPESVSLQLMDPAGNVVARVARETAEREGLDAATVDRIGTTAGMLAGMMLFPGVGKTAKKAAEVMKHGAAHLGPKASPTGKAAWLMTREELEAAARAAKIDADNALIEVFGTEGAKRYKQLERTANSTTVDPERARAATDELLRMEQALTPEQWRRVFQGQDPDEYREFARAISNIESDAETPQTLGQGLRWAVTRLGDASDPQTMTHEQRKAWAQLRRAFEIAGERGWDTKAISETALRAAARRFSDPEDAALMLERWMKTAPTSEASSGTTALPPRGVKLADYGLEKAEINVARVAGDDLTKGVMKAVNALHGERLAEARKTVTHEQTIAEAQRLKMTLNDVLRLDVEKFDYRAVQHAVRDFHNAAATHTADLMKRALKDDEAAKELVYAFTVQGEVAIRDVLFGKIGGRGQEARKILSEASRAPFRPDDIARLAEAMAGVTPGEGEALVAQGRALAQRLGMLSKEAQREFARHAVGEARKGKSNILFEAWLNWGLLSGPQTHVVNVTSNSLFALWAPVERTLAATADVAQSLVTGDPRSVYYGEAAAMLWGLFHSQKQAIRLAGQSLRSGSSVFGPDKIEFGADAARRVLTQADDPTAHAMGFWGAVFRAPTRALTAEDSYFKVLNYQAELGAQAYREAAQEGLTGQAFRARVRDLMRNPSEAVASRAEAFALAQTFNRELDDLGRVGQLASGIARTVDATPVGRLIMPFRRTPANIMHSVTERTPILNAASDTLRADLFSGNPALRAQAMGKIAGGAMLGSVIVTLAGAGLVTGGGPRDPHLRGEWLENHQPYSIRLGDTWYLLNRLDPVGAMVGLIADASDIIGQLPRTRVLELTAAITLALSRNMVSKTYLEGFANFVEIFDSHEKFNVMAPVKGFARSLMPSFLRTIERTVDPTLRETREYSDAPFSELRELLNEIQAGTPGWSATLPARHNLYGEPVLLGGGLGWDIASPIYTKEAKSRPISDELRRLKLSIPKVPSVIEGRRRSRVQLEAPAPGEVMPVELTPQEEATFAKLAGNEWKDPNTGLGMRDTLAAYITSPEYRTQLNDVQRRIEVHATIYAFRAAAEAHLIETTPRLQELIERRAGEIKRHIEAPATRIGPGLTIPGR